MKKVLTALVSGALFLSANIVFADSHEKAEDQSDPANPIEIYACSYNDGKGPADLDAAANKWNAWADKQGLDDYSAWTLVPYYSGPEQEFDVLWLGASASAKAMGRAQDDWLANGGKVQDAFTEATTCTAHSNFATVQFKAPPERDDPSNIVISFSDCNMADGVDFDDVAPALSEWADYRSEHGSTSGIWVLFPAYGGGGEEFDFKYVAAWQNLEDQGADWDQYSAGGYAKAGELFAGKLDCDSSRVYLAKNRRMAKDDEE
jgi:hypothetical protein